MGLTRIRADQISNIDYKQAVKVITLTNISNLANGAPLVVDGVTLSVGDRVLVTAQSTASQNGIYVVQSTGTGANGAWIRASDANATGDLEAGTILMVTDGATYADTSWKLITDDPIVIGTSALTFLQNTGNSFNIISTAASNVAANGVSGTVTFTAGNNFSVVGNNASDVITFSVVDAPTFVGNVSGNYFIGNGSQLTGIAPSSTYGNANVVAYGEAGWAGNIIPSANNVYSLGSPTAQWASVYVSANTLYLGNTPISTSGNSLVVNGNTVVTASPTGNSSTTGNVVVSGNITANYISGNGSALTSIAGANVTGTVANATFATSAGTATSATTAATVTTNAQPNITSVGTLTSLTASGLISTTGNITGGNIVGPLFSSGNTSTISILDTNFTLQDDVDATKQARFNLSGLTTSATVVYTLPAGAANASTLIDVGTAQTITALKTFNGATQNFGASTANSTINLGYGATLINNTKTLNIGTAGVSGSQTNINIGAALGNTTAAFSANTVITVANTSGTALSVAGNITGRNITTANQLVSTVATGTAPLAITSTTRVNNLNVASSNVADYVAAGGAINGQFFVGLISATSGYVQSLGNSNIIANASTGLLQSTLLSATGAITGASATVGTGNITAGNLLISGAITDSAQLDIQTSASNANIVLTPNGSGNVNTGANVSVTGNVQAGNIRTVGLISATGNISGGNLNVTGNIVDSSDLTITSTAANANITLTPTGTGTIIVNKNITNGQGNGVGNIGSVTSYFNTIFAKATSAQYADLAEMYCADAEYAPGTVLEFGGDKEVTITSETHTTKSAGIVSTNPSYLMNSTLDCVNAVELALVGRVPTQVVGTIRKGDRLVASKIPGVATVLNMALYQPGCIVGKALEDYNSTEVGIIEVAVGRF